MNATTQFVALYNSPVGKIYYSYTDKSLTGLWFKDQKYSPIIPDIPEHRLMYFKTYISELTKYWLDIYFQGVIPNFVPQMTLSGTPFRMKVWQKLAQIPYGQVRTYGQIAEEIAAETQSKRVSARAVGAAVGHNPISIIIPCHRVIGASGKMTGYAGGIDKKIKLLKIEGLSSKLHI